MQLRVCVHVCVYVDAHASGPHSPTAQDQPPFSFVGWEKIKGLGALHHGMPATFNFDWVGMTGYQQQPEDDVVVVARNKLLPPSPTTLAQAVRTCTVAAAAPPPPPLR